MSKAHLLSSDSPLTAGQDYKSCCGVEVVRTRFIACFDSAEMGETLDFLSPSKLCRKCRENLGAGMYVYAAISGKEGL